MVQNPFNMTGYTKLFGSIVDSTIWRESKDTKIVWITMLAKANRDGVVEASLPGLADASRVSIDECVAALKCLSSPDKYSRTKDFEGRRIEEIDGGWRIMNHAKYRAKMNADERREYFRLKKQEQRCPNNVHKSPTLSNNVRKVTHADSEADSEAEANKNKDLVKVKFSDVEKRLCKLFNRAVTDPLSYMEQSCMSEISRRQNVLLELEEVEAFKARPKAFFPQSLEKLVTQWQVTLDRARNQPVDEAEQQRIKNLNRQIK
jgi:hypothetical protein